MCSINKKKYIYFYSRRTNEGKLPHIIKFHILAFNLNLKYFFPLKIFNDFEFNQHLKPLARSGKYLNYHYMNNCLFALEKRTSCAYTQTTILITYCVLAMIKFIRGRHKITHPMEIIE